jgi:hypothetical protein
LKNWLEKHGDPALQDCWAAAKLDNSMPTRKERVVETTLEEIKASAKRVLWLHN